MALTDFFFFAKLLLSSVFSKCTTVQQPFFVAIFRGVVYSCTFLRTSWQNSFNTLFEWESIRGRKINTIKLCRRGEIAKTPIQYLVAYWHSPQLFQQRLRILRTKDFPKNAFFLLLIHTGENLWILHISLPSCVLLGIKSARHTSHSCISF